MVWCGVVGWRGEEGEEGGDGGGGGVVVVVVDGEGRGEEREVWWVWYGRW